jgi:8-oxo-dGTP diphosphatase
MKTDWTTWKPNVRATLLFVVKNNEVLLIRKKTGFGKGKINGPGGKLEPGETPLQAAVRETEEELGILPLDPISAGTLQFQFTDGLAMHVSVFTATVYVGDPTESIEAAPLWFPIDEIPFDEMWPDDRLWLREALDGRTFHGTFEFDGETMLDHDVLWLSD